MVDQPSPVRSPSSSRQSLRNDRLFSFFNYIFFIIVLLIVLYPLYWILISSFSNPNLVRSGDVWLYPKDISFIGYYRIFQYDQIWVGYLNTIIYTLLGTLLNVFLTLTSGYALARKDLAGKQIVMILITITMFFNGGLIPTYLVVRDLGLVNTMWAMILPSAVGAFNIIIARTFFQFTIPGELLESAKIDNCSDIQFFLKIAIPLSMPLVAVISIFTAVNYWNAYFPALIYLRDVSLFPLQLVLRNILILSETVDEFADLTSGQTLEEKRIIAEQIKYGVIIVSSIPILSIYPFFQKYFVKGMMIGSIKG